jgi:hypothetical protein
MNRTCAWFLIASSLSGLAAAQTPPSADAPPLLSLSEANPLACKAEGPAALTTREFPSGVTATIPAFVALRINPTGGIEEMEFVHDPIPSLEAQERQSFQKWDFTAPKKGGVAISGWATIELDLKFEYSKPQITRAALVPVSSQEALPPPIAGRWDDGWLKIAPALADLKGAESAEAVEQPALPRRTKWYADRYKGPLAAKLWIEVSEAGRATRIVPVELKDPALLPYLEAAISRWPFTPARDQGKPVSCWSVLDLGGTISYDVTLVRAASIKKSIGR